jgi:hypothetical protein
MENSQRQTLAPDDRRVTGGSGVAIAATMRKQGQKSEAIMLHDLSETGCQADSMAKLHIGDRIWISCPGLAPMMGSVEWRTPHGFGCEWSTPLHPSVFDHICQRFPELIPHPGIRP